MRTAVSILASDHVDALSLTFCDEPITASAGSRTMAGTLVRYGVPGRTSRGRLRVRPGALRFHENIRQTILTREHDRATSRGVLAGVYDGPELMRVQVQAAAGPEGDAALQEAQDGSRAAFSFDVVDATIVGDEITDALVIAIGQVGIPAYDDARIDSIAASNNPGVPMLTEAQRARLSELLAITNRDAAQQAEFTALMTIANGGTAPEPAAPAAPAPAAPASASGTPAAQPETPATPAAQMGTEAVAASMPSVPAGVPGPTSSTTTQARGALRTLVSEITAGLQSIAQGGGDGLATITAALSDITHSQHTDNIEPLAWSGELWSGLQYEPKWSDLLAQDTLTYWEGKGWRFTSKLAMQDYAGDKAAIPSGTVTTEASSYEAARAAIGVDIDRKFYDFPNEGFVNSLLEQCRESWEILKDGKSRTFILAQAKAGTRPLSVTKTSGDPTLVAAPGSFSAADVGATITGTGIPNGTTVLTFTNSGSIEMSANATSNGTITATVGAQEATVLKAAARARLVLDELRVGTPDWIMMNSQDMFSLLDVDADKVPAYLDLWGIDPKNFRSSPDVPAGTVLSGVKKAAKFRQLPGSPIRVSAQNLANGGVDEAFFGYWAIEQQHKSGIVSVKFNPAA